jgi:hypothetical protein
MTTESAPFTGTCSFYLGRIANLEHERRLLGVAAYLDANKFSTTVSLVEGRMMLLVSPDDDSPMTKDEFRIYAGELIIHALSHRLSDL